MFFSMKKIFWKIFGTKIAKKKKEENPSNFGGSHPKKFSAKQNFSRKSGGYF
jgi:hypothetical protein